MIDRRTFLIGSAALAAACAEASVTGNDAPTSNTVSSPDFAPILAGLGADARLGVFAIDSLDGRTIGHDAASRFTMCSTFKLPLAAAILAEVEAARLSLDQEIALTCADMVNNS